MNIQISSVNNNQIVITNYQLKPEQSYKIRTIGRAMNTNLNQVIIDCGREATQADIDKIQKVLG